jgi:hypothetical protein
MNIDKAALKLAIAMGKAADAGFPQEMKDIVKKHALIAAIAMAFPLFGIDTIVYIITLWLMYKKLAEMAHVPFSSNLIKNIIAGVLTNLVITLIVGIVLDFIPGLGWIGAAAYGYLVMTFSAIGFINFLTMVHDNGKVKQQYDFNASVNALKGNNPDIQQIERRN